MCTTATVAVSAAAGGGRTGYGTERIPFFRSNIVPVRKACSMNLALNNLGHMESQSPDFARLWVGVTHSTGGQGVGRGVF